jgi:hypothetical protein
VLNTSAGKIGAVIRLVIRNSDSALDDARSGLVVRSVDGLARATGARFLKRSASWRGTGLRVARTDEEFVDCDHRGASDDGNGRHHKNGFDHVFPLTDLNARTPEESCSRKTRELRGRAVGSGSQGGQSHWVARMRAPRRAHLRSHSDDRPRVPTISKHDR